MAAAMQVHGAQKRYLRKSNLVRFTWNKIAHTSLKLSHFTQFWNNTKILKCSALCKQKQISQAT